MPPILYADSHHIADPAGQPQRSLCHYKPDALFRAHWYGVSNLNWKSPHCITNDPVAGALFLQCAMSNKILHHVNAGKPEIAGRIGIKLGIMLLNKHQALPFCFQSVQPSDRESLSHNAATALKVEIAWLIKNRYLACSANRLISSEHILMVFPDGKRNIPDQIGSIKLIPHRLLQPSLPDYCLHSFRRI